jgi:hypothetical protein
MRQGPQRVMEQNHHQLECMETADGHLPHLPWAHSCDWKLVSLGMGVLPCSWTFEPREKWL